MIFLKQHIKVGVTNTITGPIWPSNRWAQDLNIEVVVVDNNYTISIMGYKIITNIGIPITFIVPNNFQMKTMLYWQVQKFIQL